MTTLSKPGKIAANEAAPSIRTSERTFSSSGTSNSSFSSRTCELRDAVIEATDTQKRLMKQRQSLTNLATLRLSDMDLHGRHDDTKLLHSTLANIKDMKRRELILVSGAPGVGKSYLVTRALQLPAMKRGIIFAGGKFDLNSYCQVPYSAFGQAFAELSKQVAAMIDNKKKKIQLDIQEVLGNEDMELIATSLPGCESFFSLMGEGHKRRRSSNASSVGSVVSSSSIQEVDQTAPSSTGREAVNRLHYAIRRLMKAICCNLDGCCIFIDDLQWADSSSLDLLQSLLQDDDIPSLLMVGAYRRGDVSESHPLTLSVKEAERFGCAITTITLENLQPQHVQSLVAEALNMSDEVETIKTLADTIYKKTKGCPFFVIFFLKSLYDDNLLSYNFAISRWRWDDQLVKEKVVTDNVASIMVNNLRKIDPTGQDVIKIAACLGHSFSKEVLEIVVDRSLTSREDDNEEVVDILAKFVHDGLLEEEGDNVCFSHDLVQSSAMELVPLEKRESFKGEIGAILLKHLSADMLEDYLFAAVSLRNCCTTDLSDPERVELAELNLKAGTKASNNAGYDSAVAYFETARRLLGQQSANHTSGKAVQIYISEAKARFIIGDMDTANELLDELLSRSQNMSIMDKFKAFEVKILIAQSRNNFDEAISSGLDLWQQLGNKPIPTRVSKIAILKEYMKVNRAVKGMSPEDLAALPFATDERVIIRQRILVLLQVSCYQVNPNMTALILLKLTADAVKHGWFSGLSFSGFGVLLCGIFGEFERGTEMGMAAEMLLERHSMLRYSVSRSRYQVHAFTMHWRAPLKGTLQPLLDGYIIGLETGDIESAGWNICFRSCYCWFSSRPIDSLVLEITPIINVLDQMKNAPAKMCTLPFLQASRNLTSTGGSPWILTSHIDIDTFRFAREHGNDSVRSYTTVVQLDLFILFGRWEDAKSLLNNCGDLRLLVWGVFHAVRFSFLEAFISLKVAQMETVLREKRKYKSRAKKTMKLIRKWLRKGNVNCLHTYHLLSAEYAVLIGKNKRAEENFKAAQITAGRSGWLSDKALAHEMAGLYHMKRADDYWAKYDFEQAHRTYRDWGATAKVSQLEKEYPQFQLNLTSQT